jgi:predicted nucleic acid-binding protein
VRVVYVDTSVLGRVLLNEPDRAAIQVALEDVDELVSSRLLWIELGRLARRRDAEFAARGEPREFMMLAQELMGGIAAIPVEDELLGPDDMLGQAERITPYSVATLDAIHLGTAVWLAEHDLLDTLMTYDNRLAEGARENGLTVLAPK